MITGVHAVIFTQTLEISRAESHTPKNAFASVSRIFALRRRCRADHCCSLGNQPFREKLSARKFDPPEQNACLAGQATSTK